MIPRVPRALAALLVLSLALLSSAAFALEDKAVSGTVQEVMTEDYPGSLGPAKKKLQDALALCVKKGCSASVKAEVYVALGMVASQLGQADEAKTNFAAAVKVSPSAKLPSSGVTPSIKSQWDEVNKSGDKDDDDEPAVGGVQGAVKLALEALKADQDGNLDVCIAKDKESLKLEEMPRTRLHLASCESRAGKLVDALKNAQRALEIGIKKRDAGVMKVARQRVKELLDRIPHVTFVPPKGVDDLTVSFDDRPVPVEALKKKFSIDPGPHHVVAKGTVNNFESVFDETIEVAERELATVKITLKPPANDFITGGQIQCMLRAKSQEDVQKCLPQNQKSLVIRVAGDLSGYSDTNAVAVYTPGMNVSLVSPTAGWNIGGNFVLDAVSAASPDLVSSASPPFEEFRYAGGVTGGYKPGLYGAQLSSQISSSPDYVSYTLGGRVTADLNEKLITPGLGYTYSYDRIGRGPNNYLNTFNPLKGFLHTHEIEAGVTLVMSPTSILVVGGTISIERGDQSQPYRYITTFDPVDVAPFVPKGATVDLVNRSRLPYRPLEQLPTERDRFAVGARYNRRFNNATLRVDERLYVDTWGVKGSSTDGRYMIDMSRHFRVWPHLRIHAQTGANFYQLAYSAVVDAAGTLILPTYRTGDRELTPLITATAGGGTRIALGPPEAEVKYGLTFVGDVMYTRYLKSLFVTTRTAVYGSVGFDVEF